MSLPETGTLGTVRAQTVFVIDDDPDIRGSLQRLLKSLGVKVRTYASAVDFLESYDPEDSGCILSDLCMPEMSGLELQQRLVTMTPRPTLVVISGHGDVPKAVECMKAGALDFITKPYSPDKILAVLQRALALDEQHRRLFYERRELSRRYDSLTVREREVLAGLMQGKMNKAIAGDLGISARTVEIHRAHVMEKMMAGSTPQLVQMVGQLHGASEPDALLAE